MANKRQRKKNEKKVVEQRPIKRMTKTQKEEFNRVRKNVMSKLRYTKRTKGETAVTSITNKQGEVLYDEVHLDYFLNTPYTRGVPKLSDIHSWEAYHAFIEKGKEFTNRAKKKYQFVKNKDGIVATETTLKRIERNNEKAIRYARKEIEEKSKIEIEGGRTTLGERLPMMGRPNVAGIREVDEFDFSEVGSIRRLLDIAKNMEKRASGKFYKDAYDTYLNNFANLLERVFHSDASEALNILRNMDASDFYDMSQKYKDVMYFDHFYKAHKELIEPEEGDLNRILEYLKSYTDGNENFDLKGF